MESEECVLVQGPNPPDVLIQIRALWELLAAKLWSHLDVCSLTGPRLAMQSGDECAR